VNELLELKSISKSFGAVKALQSAELILRPGEIRAFLGANGSGKSTIVKILSGLVVRDEGDILLGGSPLDITSPGASRKAKIAAAYQDLSLISRLSLADNIALGRAPGTFLKLQDKNRAREEADYYCRKVGLDLHPDTLVSDLDPSRKALAELAKSLAWKPSYLLVDEVTASLYKTQVNHVFELLREYAAEGTGILFVSHRMDEVFALCDSMTVLRGGRTIIQDDLKGYCEEDLVFHMTGKGKDSSGGNTSESGGRVSRPGAAAAEPADGAEPLLNVQSFTIPGKVFDVNLQARAGEIIGIAGLQGQGQSEFLRGLYGLNPDARGTVSLDGRILNLKNSHNAVRSKMGFLPGDREGEGIFPQLDLTSNIYAAHTGSSPVYGTVATKKQSRGSADSIEELNVVASGVDAPARSLSGGNQQKLVVGRWLMYAPSVLILDDPTKGVDVSSRLEIQDLLRKLSDRGSTLLYSSSDNEELLRIADRILVFFEGRIEAELTGGRLNGEELARATLGVFK